jgi:hypothetical protein
MPWMLRMLGANRVLAQTLTALSLRLIRGIRSTSQVRPAVARSRVGGCNGDQREANGKRERNEAGRSVESSAEGRAYREADNRGPGV